MLVVGTNKTPLLKNLPSAFLIVDDGQISDGIPFPKKTVHFDPRRHSFNPLKNLTWPRSLELLSIINAIFPQGEDTLTRGYADTFLLEALSANPKRLDRLIAPPAEKDIGHIEAYRKIHTLMLSPVLNRVLNNQNKFHIKNFGEQRTIVARLNRSELGDFDCFILGNLLIGQYQGHVVIPDFGFYAHPGHVSLIRQDRLTAGVNFLDEVPRLKNHMLLMDAIPSHCTFDDAETLAVYAGHARGTDGFSGYVREAIA